MAATGAGQTSNIEADVKNDIEQTTEAERSKDRVKLEELAKEKEELIREIEEIKAQLQDTQLEIDQLDEESDDEQNESGTEGTSARTLLRRGRNLFNDKAKKGIAFLIENKYIDNEAKEIARFLKETEGLNKTQIGDYLGENEELNLQVLQEFVNLHDFEGLDFDESLRSYLWSFRLPGESQKIDRMMESFAKRFVGCNPDRFSCSDTCYVLAFSVIMLNTSMHNPAIKMKPTIESFISMNRGIDNGKDLPKDFLGEIFESIKATPFKIPDDSEDGSFAFFNPERSGWLIKEGGSVRSWRKRWFTLVNNCLYYFETENDKSPKGTIPLENLIVRELNDFRRPFVFEILCEDEDSEQIKAAKVKGGKFVQGKHKSYRIQCADRQEMEEWMKCIRAAMMKDPLFELYRSKRNNVSHQ